MEGFYLLLTYADVIVLQQYRAPDEVAVYYAAAKTLALVAFFPTAGHAAAWGVLISGFLQYFLLAGDLARHGSLPRFAPLRLDEDVRAFFRAIGPATLGSMGTQVAVFALPFTPSGEAPSSEGVLTAKASPERGGP